MKSINDILKNAKEAKRVKGGRNVVSISITNHRNGKRITLSPALYEGLNKPDKLKFAFDDEEKVMLIASELDGIKNAYQVKGDDRAIIYNSSLVECATDAMQLDFSDVSSMTFTNIELIDNDDVCVAYIQF